MVLNPDRHVQLADGLLQVVAADAIRKDGHRLVQTARARRFQGLAHGGRAHRHWRGLGDPRHDGAVRPADPHLRRLERPPQRRVDDFRQRLVDGQPIAIVNLNEDIKRGRRLALEHRLLRPTAARLFVGQRDRLDAAQQIVQRRIDEKVLE